MGAAVGASFPGVYPGTLVEEIEVSSNVPLIYDFAAVLDSDVDRMYRIECLIKNDNISTNALYYLRYNGTGRVQFSTRQFVKYNAPSETATRSTIAADEVYFAPANDWSYFDTRFTIPEAGDPYSYTGYDCRGINDSVTIDHINRWAGVSTPTAATKITGLGFETDVTSGIGVGSTLRLYRS
jgi:hypothetical protein